MGEARLRGEARGDAFVPHATGTLFAGRYRIEAELARGAMGAVSRARDESTGKAVALKQLLSSEPRLLRMFEREFHTLVGLRHPRIIEVYDYGVDASGPYYTMELLDGQDFRDIAPIDYRRACRYLRDVASSLGLLHARRLLHRDLSPRNVRVTSDDRCKLIDFGGLSGFGIPNLVVGTPPCVPPEALHHAPLDQRADLYSLGALAYWLLTGRHAYPAREMAVLPEAWRVSPRPPSQLVAALGRDDLPAVPPELDELVMSLLTLNPLGRPPSAADVIDRLTMLGGLERDTDENVSSSYLLGVETVGRDRERERLRRRLAAAMERNGSCVIIDAPSGMGGTRLLSEVAIAAQLAGALPLVVDGRMNRGPYGLVFGLIDKLLEVAPKEALAAAAGHEAILARLSPALQRALDVAADATDLADTPGELRKRVQNALSAWVVALSQRRPVVLVIDNLQRVDEPSAALLATLSSRIAHDALLIVACHKPGDEVSAPIATRALRHAGASMVLRGLTRDDVHKLANLMFGDVANTARLAEWMHRISAGNPQACMDLAEHLVRRQVIRYIHGSWVLPHELALDELPRGLGEIAERRLRELPVEARKLADALSVHRGHLPIERCLALAEVERIAEPYEMLEVLVQESILMSTAGGYQFCHDTIREALLASMQPERRRQLHARVGAILEAAAHDDVESQLDAGWHLMHGGEEERGAELLARAGLMLANTSDGLSAAVPALRAALGVFREKGRPKHQLIRLLGPLAMAGYYSERRLADEVGDEAIDSFEHVIGLKLASRLRPLFGARLSMHLSLGIAALPYLFLPGRGGLKTFIRSVETYCAVVTCLVGTATICLDGERAQRLAGHLEPLSWLGADSGPAHVHRMAQLLAMIPEERMTEIIEGFAPVLARVADPRPIPMMTQGLRRQFHAGALYAVSAMEVFRDGPQALRLADQLDHVGLKLYEMVADQARSTYHALRGEVERAEMYRQRVEVHAVQSGSAWQAEVWVPASRIVVYVLTGDTIGLKRVTEELDRLSKEIPSLVRHARLARGEYHHLKGEHEQGFALIKPEIESTADRAFVGRTFGISNEAHALNHLGRYAEAKRLVEVEIAKLSVADRAVVCMYANLYRELAHAHAGLGDLAAAFAVIDEMLDHHRDSEHPVLLGNLHASAAAIAVQAGDVARALEHVTHMEHWFRPTANPALIAQCERLRREVRSMVEAQMPGAAQGLGAADSSAEESIASARSVLSHCQGADERAQFALDLLLNHVRGRSGFLFACTDGQLSLIAPQHGEEPPPALIARIQRDLGADADGDEEATVVVAAAVRPSLPPPMKQVSAPESFRTFALALPGGGELAVMGVFAVLVGERAIQPPQQAFLQAIARSMFESGDASKTETQLRRA